MYMCSIINESHRPVLAFFRFWSTIRRSRSSCVLSKIHCDIRSSRDISYIHDPANKSSAVVHVTFKALKDARYIEAESGLLVATRGFPSPVSQSGKITQLFGLRGSNI